jgi:hypothetical protein
MSTLDGRELARRNELKILKLLHRLGWSRSREAACLWMPSRSAPSKGGFSPEPVCVSGSALRMAQRTLGRLREQRLVFTHVGPDGSHLYALTEGGARVLQGLGIPATSGKDWLHRFSMAQYHHRRLANELAVIAMLQGYRIRTDREIAQGLGIGGVEGVQGKRADVTARSGKTLYWGEVVRSRLNARDYAHTLTWLHGLWPMGRNVWLPAPLPEGLELAQVVFLADLAFAERLTRDLKGLGWGDELIAHRVQFKLSLYVTEDRYILTQDKTGLRPNLPS